MQISMAAIISKSSGHVLTEVLTQRFKLFQVLGFQQLFEQRQQNPQNVSAAVHALSAGTSAHAINVVHSLSSPTDRKSVV